MDRYFLASELAFYSRDPGAAASDVTAANLFGHVGLMYERWTAPTAELGRALLLISWNAEDLDSPEVRAGVERLGPLQEGELRRDERFVRRYYYRFAFGYLGFPPKSLERPHVKADACPDRVPSFPEARGSEASGRARQMRTKPAEEILRAVASKSPVVLSAAASSSIACR